MREYMKKGESVALHKIGKYQLNNADAQTLLTAARVLLAISNYKRYAEQDKNNLPYIPKIADWEYREHTGAFLVTFDNGLEIEANKDSEAVYRAFNFMDEPTPDFNTLEELLAYINSNFKS